MIKSNYNMISAIKGTCTLISSIASTCLHIFHLYHNEATQNFFYQNFNNILSTFLGKSTPIMKSILKIEDFATKVTKEGGAKDFIKHAAQKDIDSCAASVGMSKDEPEKLLTCAIAIPSTAGDLTVKGQAFANCYGINYLNFVEESKDIISFTQCMSIKIETSVQKIKEIVAKLSKEADVAHFPEFIAEIKKNGKFSAASKELLNKSADTCAHHLSGNLADAERTAICFKDMLNVNGGAEKLQSYVTCNNVTIDNAVNTIHNTISFVQCIGKTLETSITYATIDAEGNLIS